MVSATGETVPLNEESAMATDGISNSKPTERTQSMTSRTQTFSYQPSRAALAARSLAAVERIEDPTQRYEAFSRHMREFPSVLTA
ncbi:hypothetical protein [Curtobacterium flaccumfaciens]|uniref:hypothetical protein n=1 Tax=Curtobacterium flaccumfaciens TaxID=2035 RepID=UPI003EB88E5A